MLFKNLAIASASVISMASAIETHGGVDFEVFWEENGTAETEPIRDFYVNTAAKQASTRLHKRLADQKFKTNCKVTNATDAESLFTLKECIAAEDPYAFFDIFAKDITEADAFWERVIAESTAPRSEWISARSWVRVYYDGAVTAQQFATWMSSEEADTGYLRGNAEHYYKTSDIVSPTVQNSHIFEGWGGVLSEKFGTKLTNFTVPGFTYHTFDSDEYPAEWAIDPGFGYFQRAGPKTLQSGSTWGILHIGARDVAANETSLGKDAVEVYGAVWYPPWDKSTEANQADFKTFLKDEAYQVVAEVVNFGLQALDDCKDGGC